jgi:preprotein translocase subunit SecG
MSRILFQLTALAATVFIITILASVAMLLGDPVAPMNVWFNIHGTTVLIVEVVLIVVLGLAAMTADRRETLRAKSAPPADEKSPLTTE